MEITNNTSNQQFELRMGNHMAELQYRFRGSTMYFLLTKVPDELKGQGIASKLAVNGLEYAETKGFKIAVMCPFMGDYLRKNPAYKRLLDRDYHKVDRFI